MKQETFKTIIDAFLEARDKNGELLKMDAIIVSDASNMFSHYFNARSSPNDIRSLSKTILAMSIGKAIADGVMLRGEKLSLDTKLWRYLEGKVPLYNKNNEERIKRITLRHALTHTIGFEIGLMFSKDIEGKDHSKLLEYIINTDLLFEPGEHFVYSNAGPYLVSAIIQEELGCDLASWVGRTLLEALDIRDFSWKKYGSYSAGSSGLSLRIEDLHRIARLFVSGGEWQGRSVVPKVWLDEMTKPAVRTPTMFDEKRVFPKYAYGIGLWICEDGRYYVDGTDGQYIIVLPRSQTVVTTFGHQADMKPITECLRPLLASELKHEPLS